MTAEKLLDAMNELPDSILEQTAAIRQRKPPRWQPWAAAVCLVLTAGIAYSFLLGPTKAFDAEYGYLEEHSMADADITNGYWWIVTVLTVEQDTLTVRFDSGEDRVVALAQLEEKPELVPGQRIRICFADEEPLKENPLKPYKIKLEGVQ